MKHTAQMRADRGRTLFISGTDTEVGKTVLTVMLTHYLASVFPRVRALKPFCAGGNKDAVLLCQAQKPRARIRDITLHRFRAPLAPYVAAGRRRSEVSKAGVMDYLKRMQRGVDWMLVEGCGGLMTPLSDAFVVLDVIVALGCPCLLVAPNKLGVLNQVLMSATVLKAQGIGQFRVVLMGQREPDLSAVGNAAVLAHWLGRERVFSLPYLGKTPLETGHLKKNINKVKNTLAETLCFDNFSPLFEESGCKS